MPDPGRTPLQRRIVTWIPYIWLLAFFLVPFLIVFKISLSEPTIAQPPYLPVFESPADIPKKLNALSFENYSFVVRPSVERPERFEPTLDSIRDWATYALSSLYLRAFLSSLVMAGVAALIALLVGFPIAYAMARAPQKLRPLLLMLIILPFWTSFLIRVYAWIGILKPEGLLNQFLLWIGLISEPLGIINTNWAVLIGIVYSYLPFMVLPLYASLEKLDQSLLEAAADLGARPLAAFWKITVPLAAPGIVAGVMLVFIPAVGEFVIPDLLGGSDTLMIGRTLWSEFFQNRDWPVASAVAILLLLLLVVPIVLFQDAQSRVRETKP
jgi:putrescine transport system permease protein